MLYVGASRKKSAVYIVVCGRNGVLGGKTDGRRQAAARSSEQKQKRKQKQKPTKTKTKKDG
jgi:hypothetical protein